MNRNKQLLTDVLFGVIVIAGMIFLGARYINRGGPTMKVIAVCLVAGIIYLVIDFIRSKDPKAQ